MSTKTKSKAKSKVTIAAEAVVESIAKASAKVASCIAEQTKAAVNLVSKKRATCEAILAEASRLGIMDDRKAIRTMVQHSWVLAFEAHKLPDAKLAKFVRNSQPDISKIMTLAFPANNAAAKELKASFDLNDSLDPNTPKAERIGEGNLIKIARGNTTLAKVMSDKADKKQSRNLDSVVSPYKRFYNACAKIILDAKVNGKDRITEADARKAFNEALTDALKPSNRK